MDSSRSSWCHNATWLHSTLLHFNSHNASRLDKKLLLLQRLPDRVQSKPSLALRVPLQPTADLL